MEVLGGRAKAIEMEFLIGTVIHYFVRLYLKSIQTVLNFLSGRTIRIKNFKGQMRKYSEPSLQNVSFNKSIQTYAEITYTAIFTILVRDK